MGVPLLMESTTAMVYSGSVPALGVDQLMTTRMAQASQGQQPCPIRKTSQVITNTAMTLLLRSHAR